MNSIGLPRRLNVVELRQQEVLREKEERHGEPDERDGDAGEGLRRTDLSAEPDADEAYDRDDDGEEQAADGDRHQVHRRGRRQRAEAVQEHGQDEQLDEKQRHAARPQPLMHGLLQIDRNHA